MTDLRPLDPEPLDADVDALMRALQAHVAEGRVAALGVAIVYRNGKVGSMFTEAGSFGRLLGASARLVHNLNEAMGTE